jgi:hypothetical protein
MPRLLKLLKALFAFLIGAAFLPPLWATGWLAEEIIYQKNPARPFGFMFWLALAIMTVSVSALIAEPLVWLYLVGAQGTKDLVTGERK